MLGSLPWRAHRRTVSDDVRATSATSSAVRSASGCVMHRTLGRSDALCQTHATVFFSSSRVWPRTLCSMTDSTMGHRPPGWIPDVSTFGARLALVRQAMGWGNVKLAATLCGIPVETWRTWERDGIEPKSRITQCMKIAGVTGVDYRWLALGPDGPTPAPAAAERSASGPYRDQRVVARILPPPAGKPDGRTVRTRPIADRHPSLGSLSFAACR